MKGEKEFKERGLGFRYRVCRRCGETYLSAARRGLYCENCKKPSGNKYAKKKSYSEKGKILDGV